MLEYDTLRLIWWLLLGALLIGFAITDGFDLGLAAAIRWLGRTDPERHALLKSIDPVWEGNQVWFILGGGAVFAAWPILYAASFSGLYLAMFLLLVALILRPVGFGFRNHLSDARWRSAWDWAITLSGVVPALLFGVAVGNLFLGIPFEFDALRRLLYSGGFFNLLHPFALLAGLVSLSMLVLHGTSYVAMKVGEPMAARAARLGVIAGPTFAVLFLAAGVWLSTLPGYRITSVVNPVGPSDPLMKAVAVVSGAWLDNYRAHAWNWAAPAAAVAAAFVAPWFLYRRRAGLAFLASVIVQTGTILTAGFALFPFLLPSSSAPDQSLTVWDASSSQQTLNIMMWAVVVFLPIVLAYTSWVYRVMKGRVLLETGHDSSQAN